MSVILSITDSLKHHYPSLLPMLGWVMIAVLGIGLPLIVSPPLFEEQDSFYPFTMESRYD